MSLRETCRRHVQVARDTECEVKVFAECVVDFVDHQVVRTYLDSQSVGAKCQSLNPKYRPLDTSLLTVVTDLPNGALHSYRSVLAEPVGSACPSDRIQLSSQHIQARTVHSMKQPRHSTLTVETISDKKIPPPLLNPRLVQKENGTTYIPLESPAHEYASHPVIVVELFQCWRATTFAELERQSFSSATLKQSNSFASGPKDTYVVRVSAIPSEAIAQSETTLFQTAQRVVKFLDLLVYG